MGDIKEMREIFRDTRNTHTLSGLEDIDSADWFNAFAYVDLLEAKLEAVGELLNESSEVFANKRNTVSVRAGSELGGYTKHYITSTYAMVKLKRILEKDND